MYAPTFDDLAGDEQAFFSDYFNQKPLLRRGAVASAARDILSVADLDELLHSESLRMPYVSMAKPESSYRQTLRIQGEAVTDCVVPERVYEHFRSGATIQFYSLNHFFPNLREVAVMLGEKFATRSEAVAFLSGAGAKDGPGYHWDPVDLFIVQLEGAKTWQLWASPDHRKGDAASFSRAELGDPVLEAELEPGDILYMPYNTAHKVTAKDQLSLHLSIAVRPRLWGELLQDVVRSIVDSDPAFWTFPYLNEAVADEQAVALKQGIDLLTERLASAGTRDRVLQLVEAGRKTEVPPSGHFFSDTAGIDHADETTTITRGPARLSFGDTADGKTLVEITLTTEARVSGKLTASAKPVTIRIPAEVADSLQRMGQATAMSAAEFFPGVPAERSVEAAKGLARLGVLRLVS